jgi:putative zinc finger protein
MIIPSCKEVSELLSQAQERPLTLKERFGVYIHLPLCEGCRNFLKQLRFIRLAAKRYLEREDP